MKLHVLPISANSHGPLAVLHHLKTDESNSIQKVEVVNAMGNTRTPEFLQMNPCHCCPTLQFDDGSAIWESCAVMRCLCNLFSGEKLYPSDPIQRGKIDMVMDWRNGTLYPDLFHIVYMMFGVDVCEETAKKQFQRVSELHFPLLIHTFLKETPFCYSETPTIADLAVAPLVTLLKGRKKYWAKVPQEVKDYYQRVLDAFPGVVEYVKLLDDKCTSYSGPGADADP